MKKITKKITGLVSCLAISFMFVAAPGVNAAMQVDNVTSVIKDVANPASTFNGMRASAIDSADNVYITDYRNNRVVVYDSAGMQKSVIPNTKVFAGTPFNNPVGIAIDGSNRLYVADTKNNRIVSFLLDGNGVVDDASVIVYDGADITTGKNSFSVPSGVTVYDNVMYVADTGNSRIVRFNQGAAKFDYSSVITIDDVNPTDTVNPQPYAIAVGNGYIWATDPMQGKVFRIPTGSGTATDYDALHCYGIGIDSANRVYVTERRNDASGAVSRIRCLESLTGTFDVVAGSEAIFGQSALGLNVQGNEFWAINLDFVPNADGVSSKDDIFKLSISQVAVTPPPTPSGGGGGGGGAIINTPEEEIVNPTPEAVGPEQVRLAGYDRIASAVEMSKSGWTQSDYVVLAYAYSFPDALAAAPLAYKYNAPILLSDNSTLSPETLAEIQRLNATNIIMVGGTAVLSQNMEDSLKANYTVSRYNGLTRYDTAASIANALDPNSAAVIVNGEFYPDALVISSYAANKGVPILFTNVNDGMPAVTAQTLSARGVTNTIVVGGTAMVSDQVFNQLPSPVRYGGYDRYETATIVASALGLNAETTFVVTGIDFPDALVAGNLAAKTFSPLVMVSESAGLPSATESFFKSNASKIKKVMLIGGTVVVKDSHMQAINQIFTNVAQTNNQETNEEE